MKAFLGLVVAALALCACGSALPGAAPGPSTAAEGTVAGQVLSYPCAPVERVGSPCAGRPSPGVEVTLTPVGGGAATQATTGADGRYRVQVAAGSYQLSVHGRPLGTASRVVDVPAGGVVTADFVIDSGIR